MSPGASLAHMEHPDILDLGQTHPYRNHGEHTRGGAAKKPRRLSGTRSHTSSSMRKSFAHFLLISVLGQGIKGSL